MANTISKVVLAYPGGLDTSVILKWLQDTYRCEVVTFTADIGQGEELEPARAKAKAAGVTQIYVDDLREEFVRDFVYPMFRANAIYEGEYLLGTSIARPLIAKRQIEIARETNADAVAHGATGKGNDQVRFELGYYALEPDIRVIAPWREWDLTSREKLLEYAAKHGIPIEMKHKAGGSPYSMDANLLHISYEGRALEDPAQEPEEDMWRWTASPEKAPDAAEYLELEYAHGDIVALNGKGMTPAQTLRAQPHWRQACGSPRSGRKSLRRQVSAVLRNAGRHDHAESAPGDRIDLPRPGGRASKRRADAALCEPDLQRLLVVARAHPAADDDRRVAGSGQRLGAPQALQG
jgi:argininosuccinate synthase